MPIGRRAHRAAASAGGDKCGIQTKNGHAVAQHNRPQQIRKDFLHKRALLIFAYSRYAQAAKILARISSPYVKSPGPPRFAKRALGRGSGTRPRGSPGLQTRALRRRRLWLWQVSGARQKRSDCSRQARRGLRAISGQSHAKRRLVRCGLFLPDRRRASSRNPGFGLEAMLCAGPNGVSVWQRAALRQGWQVCGCSAVCVILQDWQDRWNVAQIGDIPETGDPRCRSHMPAPHAPSVPDTCR